MVIIPTMTREEAYDQLISPLVTQIIALSKEHDIPMIAAFDLDDERDSPERPHLACITSILEKNADERFHKANRALYPRPEFMAFTVITEKQE